MTKINSIILSLYIFLASVYYFFSLPIRAVIFLSSLLLVAFVGFKLKNKKLILKTNKKVFAVMFCIFAYTLFVQIINGTFTIFVIYYLTSPILAYFVYINKFKTSYLAIPFYLFSSYLFMYFLIHKNLFGVLNDNVSENYVSIILIMNLSILYVIKYRQGESIPVFPAFLGLILSILAIGRSGIITTLFIFLVVLWLKFKNQSRFMQITTSLIVLLPLIAIVIIKWKTITLIFDNLEVFEKFSKSGVSSPSRGIIQRAYFSNINLSTLFTGYNYEGNVWFQHYGLNPHNSYIRLHYFSGIAFFFIIVIILKSVFILIKKNLFFAGLLIAILLRSYTDSVLFLTLFDFVPLLFILIAILESKNKKGINQLYEQKVLI